MGRFHKALPKVKSAYVTLQDFTPDLHKIYTDISAISVTLCNSASKQTRGQQLHLLSGKTPRKRIGGSVCRNNLNNPESWSLTFCFWILKELSIALIWHLSFYWSPLWRRPWEPSWGWGWWWWRWRRSGRRGTGRWLSTEAGGQSWEIDRWTERENLF